MWFDLRVSWLWVVSAVGGQHFHCIWPNMDVPMCGIIARTLRVCNRIVSAAQSLIRKVWCEVSQIIEYNVSCDLCEDISNVNNSTSLHIVIRFVYLFTVTLGVRHCGSKIQPLEKSHVCMHNSEDVSAIWSSSFWCKKFFDRVFFGRRWHLDEHIPKRDRTRCSLLERGITFSSKLDFLHS